jgi:hypothetical protein
MSDEKTLTIRDASAQRRVGDTTACVMMLVGDVFRSRFRGWRRFRHSDTDSWIAGLAWQAKGRPDEGGVDE